MTYSVTVSNPNKEFLWKKDLDSNEFLKFEDTIVQDPRKEQIHFSTKPGIYFPIRTNNISNFVKDFFFPTLINQALKIQNIFLKILASVVAIILDFCTFPIRIVTCIPRIIQNKMAKSHPLETYLKKEGAKSDLFKDGKLIVEINWTIPTLQFKLADSSPKTDAKEIINIAPSRNLSTKLLTIAEAKFLNKNQPTEKVGHKMACYKTDILLMDLPDNPKDGSFQSFAWKEIQAS